MTKTTSAFFEPALDYVVCKIPRWDLGKFHGVARELGSSMKSVGEVMAIGRTFEEAIQKGLRMIGQGMHGFVENKELVITDIDKALHEPTDTRIFVISKAFRAGYTVDQIHELTKIDRWFLQKLYGIMCTSKELHKLTIDNGQLTISYLSYSALIFSIFNSLFSISPVCFQSFRQYHHRPDSSASMKANIV